MEPNSPAFEGPLERQVRALELERAAFEAAMAQRGYHQPPSLYRDRTYRDTCYSAGWDAWQAARGFIALAWDGCVHEAPGGDVDIGASIRACRLVDVADAL
jgi:hypothetical protein